MTSFTETANFDDFHFVSEQNPSCSKSNDTRKNSMSLTDMNNVKGPKSANKEMDFSSNKENGGINLKYKNNLDICGIHSRKTPEKNEQATTDKIKKSSLSSKNEIHPGTDRRTTDKANEENSSRIKTDIPNSSSSNKQLCSSPNIPTVLNNVNYPHQNQPKEQNHKTCNTILLPKENSDPISPLQYSEQEINLKPRVTPQKQHVDNTLAPQSSLPDILSTLNKSLPNEKIKESDAKSESPSPEVADLDKEIFPKSKSLLSQTSYLPNFLSSEALHNEVEMELNQLQNLHSLQANQSIYKLAYDENITDQSEADSRSPSPVDPESQVPSSLINDEIIIHEADSGSDAGSEDVELLPHRYESESFLKENKNVYVNKLSLAVELLRTQESLPYDDEFKRIDLENNQLNAIVPGVHTGGKTNQSFVEDSSSSTFSSNKKPSENKFLSSRINKNEALQYQLKHSVYSNTTSNDNSGFDDIEFENLEEQLCEPAKEVVPQNSDIQDNTEGIKAGYRRFGIQARNYFAPRALNPCICCIIM